MTRLQLAIALCRVSTVEQLQNNSLNRQKESVLRAANELGVEIPNDGWWSGSVSSKRGTNVNRKDLNEMVERCKKDKRIKYVIVDEPDRFMRSIDEAAYFEVTFRELGVTVWYASDPELNKGDLAAKLLKFTKYLSAEGSNEERQRKSIAGQSKALAEGRYPFVPKPGYKRGYERAIHEIHPVRGPVLQRVLIRLAGRLVTPTQALRELNESEFMHGHAPYKMDKFRLIATDPFYAGIVEINKQVKVRNENGLHQPLISKEQHYQLLGIFDQNTKSQSGPRKNGNPQYPANNITICAMCLEKRNGRYVGFNHSNGRPNGPTYQKYRCRSCGAYLTRQELHRQIANEFKTNKVTQESREEIIKALKLVWREREDQSVQEKVRMNHKIASLESSIVQQVEAVSDPTNAAIKDELLTAIASKKSEIKDLQGKLDRLQTTAAQDEAKFLRYAYGFVDDMSIKFLDPATPQEHRLRCKQIVFPAGFYVNEQKKVYTPEKSILITLGANKKGAEAPSFSHMVRVTGL